MKPGEYLLAEEDIELNAGRKTAEIEVTNTGDRPIQIGSHYHFFEVNPAMRFDRQLAYGMRLNIPSGMAMRFEPGDSRRVPLVAFAGLKVMMGHRGQVNGPLSQHKGRHA